MTNPLVNKLKHFAPLTDVEVRALDDLCGDVRTLPAGYDLIEEGDRPEVVFLLVEGWGFRYKILRDGSRQIMAFLVPGDLCDVHVYILKAMDHSLGLLSDARVAVIPKHKIIELFDDHPNLARALWWSTMVDEGILREWLVNMGRRDAFDRVAHLFSELWIRMRMVGLIQGNSIELPITQADLADTLGLTAVHINRTLQKMRAEKLIEVGRGKLRIPDVMRLQAVSKFDPNYLHLDPRPLGDD